jgi:hypothetical protein
MNIFETGEATRSAEPKWFSGLYTRFRDYALKQSDLQSQKEVADAAYGDAKSADAMSAARLNIGQIVGDALIKPNAFGFGRQAADNGGKTGILNEICQNIVYMKQVASENSARQQSAKPPKPEDTLLRGHWEGGSVVTLKGNLSQFYGQDDSRKYLDVATLRPIETVDENWATTGGLLHLDDNVTDFMDAAGNIYSLDRSFLWEAEARANLPANVTIRTPLNSDGELPGMTVPLTYGTFEWSTGFSVSFHGGLERPASEYAKLYGETLEKYNSGEMDSDEFDRRVEIMDKYFDEVSRGEQSWLRSTISSFSRAMRVSDSGFFNAQTDSDVNAFLSDVGRMYDNIRNHIKSGGDIAGLTKEIIEAGCTVSGLDDVKFLHSDKFWRDYMAPAMKAYEAERGLFTTTVGAKWVEEHANTWTDLSVGADADAISQHLKNLLLKLVNYGNDYRPGSFLQQRSYTRDGSLKV